MSEEKIQQVLDDGHDEIVHVKKSVQTRSKAKTSVEASDESTGTRKRRRSSDAGATSRKKTVAKRTQTKVDTGNVQDAENCKSEALVDDVTQKVVTKNVPQKRQRRAKKLLSQTENPAVSSIESMESPIEQPQEDTRVEGRATVETGHSTGLSDVPEMPDASFDEATPQEFTSDMLFDPQVQRRGKMAVKQALVAQSEKLHKVLADAGLGSRRDMEQLILEGRISVNGEPAHLGQRVLPTDVVRMNGKVVKQAVAADGTKQPPRVLVYNKPAGQIVSTDDPQGRPTVFEHLPKVSHGRWISVGRLDFNTEGLLLFTTNGELANRLMHPRYRVERQYAVRAVGEMTQEAREALTSGVELEDGPAAFSSIEEKGGEGANRWYLVGINEGRNREVRRMFAAVGLTVSRLIRVRYGAVQLPKSLERGKSTELRPDWVSAWMADLRIDTRELAGGGASRSPMLGAKSKKKHFHQKGGSEKPHRIDPMTSTVHYLASGSLGQSSKLFSKRLVDETEGFAPRSHGRHRFGGRRFR